MTTKEQIERERQRDRINHNSLFGVWIDAQMKIRVRITPVQDSVRVRIIDILDKTVIDAIVFFCGIDMPPRRSRWDNFDLVTNLRRPYGSNSYEFGDVRLPNAPHRTTASLIIIDKSHIQLVFFSAANQRPDVPTGSITFYKEVAKSSRR